MVPQSWRKALVPSWLRGHNGGYRYSGSRLAKQTAAWRSKTLAGSLEVDTWNLKNHSNPLDFDEIWLHQFFFFYIYFNKGQPFCPSAFTLLAYFFLNLFESVTFLLSTLASTSLSSLLFKIKISSVKSSLDTKEGGDSDVLVVVLFKAAIYSGPGSPHIYLQIPSLASSQHKKTHKTARS